MGCPGDVAESVLGHMIPGVAGVYNRHQYDEQRVSTRSGLKTAKVDTLSASVDTELSEAIRHPGIA